MNNLMQQLERWGRVHGLGPSAMSRLIGANSPQAYTNWITRDSLPKEYYPQAAAILSAKSPAEARTAIKKLRSGGQFPLPGVTELLEPMSKTAKLEAVAAISRDLSRADTLKLIQLLTAQLLAGDSTTPE